MSGTSTTKGLLRHLGGMPVLSGIPLPYYDGHVWFVDHSHGSDSYDGQSLKTAKVTIQAAITAAKAGDVILVQPGDIAITETDPNSYAENLVIPNTHPFLSIIGIGRGRTQGGLPQLKVGATTTQALLTIRAPGVYIGNMGFNGAGATGGGILIDDNATTKVAFGLTIENCHFKNCVGTNALSSVTGGAIQWSSSGGGWQTLIRGNRFFKNVCDITVMGTSTIPQDVVIEDNIFGGPAASVDCNLFMTGGGDGVTGLIISRNVFTALPALSSGVNTNFLVLTGCVGILCDNMFACEDARTFGAAGDELVPTTMFMIGNRYEKAVAQVANGDDICRT